MRIPVSAAPRNTHGATNSTPVPPTRTPSRYALIESRPGMPDRNRTVADFGAGQSNRRRPNRRASR